ncbi:MAG: sigma-70 family RNA polymerase sigma factor [Ilumatobacter sp.]
MATKPLLASLDIDELAREYRLSRDIDVRNRIVDKYSWFADRCARRFARRGEPFIDLKQVAHLGLVNAAERYDPDRGSTFQSFADPTIMGELRRHFRDHTWALRVSRASKDLRPLVLGASEQLEQRFGRPATFDEIAAYTTLERSVVIATFEANSAYRTWSMDRPAINGSGSTLNLIAVSDDQEPEDRLDVMALVQQLDERTRRVVYGHFFEDRTQRDIGSELGIGQVQVSRLLKSALRQLRSSAVEQQQAPTT